MSGYFEEQLVKIPFQVRGGGFMFFFGGPLPELREGTYGEILVDRAALKNPEDNKRLNEKRRAFFLKKTTSVLIRVKPSDLKDAKTQSLLPSEKIKIQGSHEYRFAEVLLEETLYLQFRGSKLARLCACSCRCPKLAVSARSLNHAYSLLSGMFEAGRISHAGNIFLNAFVFHQGQDRWISLDEAREERLLLYEERLASENSGGKSA